MSDLIEDFEIACTAAGLAPVVVLREAGLNSSTWFRWKAGTVSPTLRSFDAARRALARLTDKPGSHDASAPALDDAATLTVAADHGADNPDANISRTGVAA
jgi:hypothetical protein